VSIAAIDLNLLLVLHVVLAEQNVARAADRLHVTPSAVSNALARLRSSIGDPLVTRKGRGIVPTPRAVELAPILARTMRDLELALVTAPFDPATCTRRFTLAVADVGQVVWVPRLAAAMRKALPRAHLRVVGIEALISLGDLGSSEVDVHVGIAGKGPGLHAERLFEERTELVARRGHAAGAKVSRRGLGELQHVRVEMVPAKRFHDPFAAAFAQAGIARDIVVTVPSFSAAIDVVAATDLVTMVPSSMIRRGLRALATPLPVHATTFSMSWHERTHSDPAAHAFRALVRAAVTSRPGLARSPS